MENKNIETLLEKQREYFYEGETLSVDFRIKMLKKLKSCILKREKEIEEALYKDLGKSDYEAYMCEIGLALTEITYMIKNTRKLASKKRVRQSISQFPSICYTKNVPYGNVLIMSPWNYPFLLTIDPLVDAIAAGNTAMIKPSAYAKHTSAIIKEIMQECFDEKYVCVIEGGRKENEELLNQKFDMIFFTGSTLVGKEVLRKAAENITPAVLELGGKSPCIVDESADIKMSAKRIIFAKFINCGQTCVAPDYVLCHSSVKEELIKELVQQIYLQYGKNAFENENYGHIINEKHYERVLALIEKEKVVCGGKTNKKTLQIEPTIMKDVSFEDKVMQEEIFGPVLPILTYDSFEELFTILKEKDKPLALYVFSENKNHIEQITNKISYGGGCINDCIVHLASSSMGFGGVGESGMGAYHGKVGFEAFSHTKSIAHKKKWPDLPMRYQPYKKYYKGFVKKVLR